MNEAVGIASLEALADLSQPWVCVCCRHHMTAGDLKHWCTACQKFLCPRCQSHDIYPADGQVIELIGDYRFEDGVVLS